jgi:hypothetical protein
MAHKITDMRENLVKIGNEAKKKYEKTNDLKTALVAIKSYREATRTSVAQIQYKKLTGTPTGIAFLEE